MNRRTFLRSLPVAVFTVGCWRPPQPRTDTAAAERLLDLMNRRLALMADVARAKWNTRSPIDDPPRERALLAAVAESGREFGLDPADTTAFFTAQIEAAKAVQRACFREWEAAARGPFPDAPDLVRDMRPKIDAVGRELLAGLKSYLANGRLDLAEVRALAEARLTGDGVTPEARSLAIRPLARD
ncbi:gamma subclass chorismate mutase AroQ [Gemmata sp.]|uniref:gamma subclass chorismate mutase AroQ n=1 Tax=Gemmata sp. TaxID=1914242 RepID=UPI003F71181A